MGAADITIKLWPTEKTHKGKLKQRVPNEYVCGRIWPHGFAISLLSMILKLVKGVVADEM
jgi:hypothetical protein